MPPSFPQGPDHRAFLTSGIAGPGDSPSSLRRWGAFLCPAACVKPKRSGTSGNARDTSNRREVNPNSGNSDFFGTSLFPRKRRLQSSHAFVQTGNTRDNDRDQTNNDSGPRNRDEPSGEKRNEGKHPGPGDENPPNVLLDQSVLQDLSVPNAFVHWNELPRKEEC